MKKLGEGVVDALEMPGRVNCRVHPIVVPLNLEVLGDRALSVARSLAALAGVPIELRSITSPRMDGFRDAWLLERRVKADGIGSPANYVLYDDNPALAHPAERPGS
jgi:hypothetical protein